MKKSPNSYVPPKASRNYQEIIIEELLAFGSFLKHNWFFILPALLVLAVLIYIVRPLPPKHLRLATGQPNSTFQVIGEQYQQFFSKHGIAMELIATNGAQENLELLQMGQVDAAFSQGGLKIEDSRDIIRSLGSISLQPLWLFYRGSEIPSTESLNNFLVKRRVSLNVPGSGTRTLAETILRLHKINPDAGNFEALSSKEGLEALKSGRLDAMFLVAGVESKNLRDLLVQPGIRAFNFDLADAYTKRYRYLDLVSLPKGALDFNPISPQKNINMVATSVAILTTDALHPAHQLLFLEAATEFDDHRIAIFNRETKFPSYTDQSIPESDFAHRFYKQGTPVLWGRAPFWLVSLFDEIWFYLFAAGAILIPIYSFVPSYRKTHAELSIEECYTQLRHIEVNVIESVSQSEFEELLAQIDQLKDRIWRLWVPSGIRPAYYDLRTALLSVRHDIVEKLTQTTSLG